MSEEANRTAELAGPTLRQGLPDEAGGGNQGDGLFLGPKEPFSVLPDRHLCRWAFQAYLEAMTVHFPFQNSYAALPANFFARVAPTPVVAPRLIKLNRPLAVQLGLDPDLLETPEGAEILAGKRIPEGADPIAMAYAGHQFGQFVPQLGDGRAILLGEVIDRDGVRRDIQLKGSGPHPVLPPRRRPRRARSGAARIHRQRSDVRVGHSDHALARSRHHRRARHPRDRAARCGADACGLEPHPRRHVPVFRRTPRHRRDPPARRSRHRPPLSRATRCRPALSRAACRRRRAPGRTRRTLAAGRLHPWRDEHRQQLDLRRDHRLRPLRLHGRLQSRAGVLLDRRDGPLRLCQPAPHRAVESDPTGRMPAAAVRRRAGEGDRAGAGDSGRIPRHLQQGLSGRLAQESRPVHRRAMATRR